MILLAPVHIHGHMVQGLDDGYPDLETSIVVAVCSPRHATDCLGTDVYGL